MRILILTAAVLGLAACSPAPAPAPSPSVTPAAEAPPPADAVPSQTDAGDPKAVLRDWANALEVRDWDAARALWGDSGNESGLTPEAFAAAYEKYRTLKVEIADAEVEGAAGSLYYQPNVVITGELADGKPYRLEGPVTLKRVNDVPGATAEQLRWHISESGLKPRP